MSQIQSGGAVLTPAYGRDYTSRVDVLRDLNAGKDFVANIGASSGYIGLSDLADGGRFQVRYSQIRKTFVFRVDGGKAVL